ncbi:nuclear transcription factor Y subunit alpha isoform X3 [Aplysia californica]|uniref:Nuclear transcription factor Y subunit n=1 Tax=Aplysia californica TaxID=6500 RepID=A0ABM1W0U0_APLCA|nr:nuclear transcription factor Y subunit alpha isoform X3 [Aplysia californica]
MDLQQTSVMNFDPNTSMGQYVQAQNALQNFQLPLQQLQGQGQIQMPGQLPLVQLGQGQFILNQNQLLQQLGQNQPVQLQAPGQAIQLAGQQGQAIHLPSLQQNQHLQSLQLQGQQGQALQLQGQATAAAAQPIQIQGQNGQTIQLQGQNGQALQVHNQNGQQIQLQGQNGQAIHIQNQNGQHIQIQGQNGQPLQLQGQNGQQIQLQGQNGQQIQLQGQAGQSVQLPNGQTIQLNGQNGQLVQLQNGQPLQLQPQQLAQLQGQQLQLHSQGQPLQLQNQLGQALHGQQLQAVQLPGQQLQLMSLQGQPCQVVHVQNPNGQIVQQVVPLMLGADQLGGLINPVQQQMLLQAQAQNQNQLVGQFVQTESGLVWQPTGVFGGAENQPGLVQLGQGAVASQSQPTVETSQPQDFTPASVAEPVPEAENSESQQSAIVNGDSMSSVPGSTNTTTTSTPQPVGRIQIAAEDPDEDTRPLYVNAKQYHRILKRRAARAKLESTGKVVRKRKKYLHESRHKHACQRTRGVGGRFFSIKVENESEFGLKEEPGSPHLIPDHSMGSASRSPSPSQPHLQVDETDGVTVNGHL